MRNKQETATRKVKHPIRLFVRAIAYRVPLPVTKVLVLPNNNSYPICPKCLISLEREYMSFCDRCGQKLNWDLLENATVCHTGYKKNNYPKSMSLFGQNETHVTKDIFGGFVLERTALGNRIRESRVGKGYTQQCLADRTGIGVVYISEIERGVKMPSLNVFIKLIDALDVSADYVLREELTSGEEYIYDEITQKLKGLTPKQRKTAADILDAYLCNLD